MKVIDDGREDSFGKPCIIFPKNAKIQDIYEYLHKNYFGYKFCIVIDCMHDEYEELGNICVNFFGDMADEAADLNDNVVVTNRWYNKAREALGEK